MFEFGGCNHSYGFRQLCFRLLPGNYTAENHMESANVFQEKDWSLFNLSCLPLVSLIYSYPPNLLKMVRTPYLTFIRVPVVHPSAKLTMPCGLPQA